MTSTAQNKAPGAVGAAAEGQTQSPREDQIMSHDTTNALLAPPASPAPLPTQAEIDFCSQFADYKLEHRLTSRLRTEEERPDGSRWREIGGIIIIPDQKIIRVLLRKGSTEADLQAMDRLVMRVKQGEFSQWGFEAMPSAARPGTTLYVSDTITRRLLKPMRELYQRALITCDEPNCTSFNNVHTYSPEDDGTPYVVHTAQEIRNDDYSVELRRVNREPWTIEPDAPAGELTAAVAASFANDILWLVAECNKLNNAEKGMVRAQ